MKTAGTFQRLGTIAARLAWQLKARREEIQGSAGIAAPSEEDGPLAQEGSNQRPDATTGGVRLGANRRRNGKEIVVQPHAGDVRGRVIAFSAQARPLFGFA